ncbi:hypothetical protein WG922_21545 [Ramlibacter sp. AN1015]|uniref:hypothetical protein n=1 Tax=Ramlibacter sp. AN1015 TaxID=3133428 RepID=UPI0030C56F3E
MSKVEKVDKPRRVKTGGRKPGTPNKLSATVKDNVLSVFEQLGGVEHMAMWAAENPTPFYNLYAKLIPTESKATVAVSGGLVLVPGKNV